MQETGLAVQGDRSPTVMQILADAVMKNDVSVDVVERLVKLQGEMMDRSAKQAYAEAFAEFKKEVPTIVKSAAIEVKGTVRSKYAKLEQIAEKVIPFLLKHGLTNRWKTRTADDGKIFVTCYIRHIQGYEEEGSTLASAPDTSGSMNHLQGQGSTVAYLERYTFVASCGIVVKDQDQDGGDVQRMTNGRYDECRTIIESARTNDELKTAYFNACKEADEIGDKLSKNEFEGMKNQRYRQINGSGK